MFCSACLLILTLLVRSACQENQRPVQGKIGLLPMQAGATPKAHCAAANGCTAIAWAPRLHSQLTGLSDLALAHACQAREL